MNLCKNTYKRTCMSRCVGVFLSRETQKMLIQRLVEGLKVRIIAAGTAPLGQKWIS